MDFNGLQRELRVKLMPSGDELARLAQRKVGVNKRNLVGSFNDYLSELLSEEFEIYKEYEKRCSKEIIRRGLEEGFLTEQENFAKTIEKNYNQIWSFFLSLSQSRKARAGGSFENHVKYLFELLDYPFDRQTILDGKVDYVVEP